MLGLAQLAVVETSVKAKSFSVVYICFCSVSQLDLLLDGIFHTA